MLAGDAGEDELVGGRGLEHAVLQDGDVAVSALGDPAAPVEDGLVTAPLHGTLVGQHAGDEVQGLDVAQLEADVLHGNELVGLVHGLHGVGLHIDEQGGLGVGREGMVAHGHAPGDLPVQEVDGGVLRRVDDLLQLGLHLVPLHFKGDLQQAQAVVHPVQVVIQGKGHPVGHTGGLVNAVAKVEGAVAHGDGHLLQGAHHAVIISYIFPHGSSFLSRVSACGISRSRVERAFSPVFLSIRYQRGFGK